MVVICSLGVINYQQSVHISLIEKKLDTQDTMIRNISIAMDRFIEKNSTTPEKIKTSSEKNSIVGMIVSFWQNTLVIEAEVDKESLKEMAIQPEIGKSLPMKKYSLWIDQETKFFSKNLNELKIWDMVNVELNSSVSDKNLNAISIWYLAPLIFQK